MIKLRFAAPILLGAILVPTGIGFAQDGRHGENLPPGTTCPVTGATFTATTAASPEATRNPDMNDAGKPASAGAFSNKDWWPNQLDLKILHQNSPAGNPLGEGFDYAEEFKKLDLDALTKDVDALMTTSQDW